MESRTSTAPLIVVAWAAGLPFPGVQVKNFHLSDRIRALMAEVRDRATGADRPVSHPTCPGRRSRFAFSPAGVSRAPRAVRADAGLPNGLRDGRRGAPGAGGGANIRKATRAFKTCRGTPSPSWPAASPAGTGT
jgi:hypothetical protein